MNNIAIIKQGTGRYLFSVPDNVTLKEGDRVKCDTKRGITDGVAFADSAWVDENVSQLIGKLTGAKFPLKSVVGKMAYQPFEKPEEKPAEPTEQKEPVKLYCFKEFMPGTWFAKGKVYETNDKDLFTADDGYHPAGYEWRENYSLSGNSQWSDYLVPLVKRTAKVGEYVLLDRDDCFHKNKQGDVVEVVKVCKDLPDATSRCFINDPTLEYIGGICVSFESNYSYVLDGYHPEPEKEPEPEYYNRKVVCVSSGDESFTVGKMYEFVNGKIKDNDGDERPFRTGRQFKSVEEWNNVYGMPIARFIEFKGEAND